MSNENIVMHAQLLICSLVREVVNFQNLYDLLIEKVLTELDIED